MKARMPISTESPPLMAAVTAPEMVDWLGARTLEINRDSAIEDARAILRLPADHEFASIEFMKENL